MVQFADASTLFNNGSSLYRTGNYSAAALAFAECWEAARTLGDLCTAFEAGVWEAESWRMQGDLRRTHGLLLSLLTDSPPDAPYRARWLLHKELLEVQIAVRPECIRVKRRLSELEELALRQAHPAADLDFCRGQVAECRCEWEAALAHFARGWHAYDAHSMTGSASKHDFPWRALCCSLRLGRRKEAESWWQHLSMTHQHEYEEARVMLKEASLLLALEAGDRTAVAECVEKGCGSKVFELRGQLFMRGDSLDPLHDPSDPSHPARALAKLERVEIAQNRFENVLALVDYRLACIRYTAGLPALDDLYYRIPDLLPRRIMPADPIKLHHQVQLFGISWRLLKGHAQRMDELLDCDYRTKEAEARRQRCDAIVGVCGAGVLRQR